MEGNLEGSASPKIEVELYGMLGGKNPPHLFEAVIDTGFTGGVSMPISRALPLGLVLFSTANFTLADGSTEKAFLCFGNIVLEGKESPIIFSLSEGNDILLGTEFLSTFRAQLTLDYKTRKFIVRPQEREVLPPPTPQQPSSAKSLDKI